jgi:hypothetical protein
MRLDTSDPRRLSRLHWEDVIRCRQGHFLKLYVTKQSALSSKGWWGDTFINVIGDLNTKPINFNRNLMYCFDIQILNAPLHDSIFKGDVSLSQLQTLFHQGDGFSVSFVGTRHIKLSISWKKMLHSADDLMLFSSPLPRNQLYSRYFHGKETITSLRMAFHQAAKETAGDYSASSALMLAFQKEEKKLLKAEIIRFSGSAGICNRDEIIPDGSNSLLKDIDERCKEAFFTSASGWVSYHEPLLSDDDYNMWINRVQVHFPSLWKNLSHVRNINDRQTKHLLPGKKIQVLHQILTTLRQRDSRILKWWALIESMGMMSLGVGRSALDTLSYLGTHVSSSTRDRLLGALFGPLFQEHVQQTMASTSHIALIIDNFQVGQRLKNQRGGHSSNFMSGTNQIAEKPRYTTSLPSIRRSPKVSLNTTPRKFIRLQMECQRMRAGIGNPLLNSSLIIPTCRLPMNLISQVKEFQNTHKD